MIYPRRAAQPLEEIDGERKSDPGCSYPDIKINEAKEKHTHTYTHIST
jgi:hypothetical protein